MLLFGTKQQQPHPLKCCRSPCRSPPKNAQSIVTAVGGLTMDFEQRSDQYADRCDQQFMYPARPKEFLGQGGIVEADMGHCMVIEAGFVVEHVVAEVIDALDYPFLQEEPAPNTAQALGGSQAVYLAVRFAKAGLTVRGADRPKWVLGRASAAATAAEFAAQLLCSSGSSSCCG